MCSKSHKIYINHALERKRKHIQRKSPQFNNKPEIILETDNLEIIDAIWDGLAHHSTPNPKGTNGQIDDDDVNINDSLATSPVPKVTRVYCTLVGRVPSGAENFVIEITDHVIHDISKNKDL